jgi:hypothetical protein
VSHTTIIYPLGCYASNIDISFALDGSYFLAIEIALERVGIALFRMISITIGWNDQLLHMVWELGFGISYGHHNLSQ